MKKILNIVTLLAFLVPASAFAAYNDVTLTTDTTFTVNGITLNVSGSSATIESITVDDSKLNITIAEGSSITVDAPNRNILVDAHESGVTTTRTNTCTSSSSQVTITGGTGQSVVSITPSTSLCGGSGGGGGGGGGSSSAPAATPAVPATPATPTTPATPATPASPAIKALVAQLQSLIAQIKAMGGTVSSSLEATVSSLAGPSVSSAPSAAFTRNLQVGSSGEDVKRLQQWLNANGFPVAASGPGSPGSETTVFGAATRAALAKFQASKGVVPAAGYFGPKTRAVVNGM